MTILAHACLFLHSKRNHHACVYTLPSAIDFCLLLLYIPCGIRYFEEDYCFYLCEKRDKLFGSYKKGHKKLVSWRDKSQLLGRIQHNRKVGLYVDHSTKQRSAANVCLNAV